LPTGGDCLDERCLQTLTGERIVFDWLSFWTFHALLAHYLDAAYRLRGISIRELGEERLGQEHSDSEKVFDAAKAIVETLKDLDTTHRERAIRFASEQLGLGPPHQAPNAQTVGHAMPTTESGATRLTTDIKQFTIEKAPKSDQQFAALVAYYYQFEAPEPQRKESIGVEDLKQAARLARRRLPKNASFTLNNAKNAGYLDNAERGKFRINTVGENLVAMTLPGTGSARVSTRKTVRRKSTGQATKKAAGVKSRK
jgi:hypothetical protein